MNQCVRVLMHLGGLMAVQSGGYASAVMGQVQQPAHHPLGTVDFPISCSQPAQVEFNRAVALLHHMTYPQAREAFGRVATTIPSARWRIGASQ